MTLPQTPNRQTPSSLTKGDEGWPVYGLQAGLEAVGYALFWDGDFGAATDAVVRDFQYDFKLGVDGVAGTKTQAKMVALIDRATHKRHDELPEGLLRGFADSEGGNNIGAVNWNIKGGVDCGVVQIRCYGPPFKIADMHTAYNPRVAMERVAVTFIGRAESYRTMDYASTRKLEFAQRCAALSWNWPAAAEQYAKNGRLSSPTKDATWAVIQGRRVKFPDGAPVMTYKDWAEFYAMGSKHGEGRVTRFVNW
jgi:hypothetical protein